MAGGRGVPHGRGILEFWDQIFIDPEANDSAKINFDTAPPEGERPDRERMRGITGRSPSFGDHPSGRQMRKYVWRSRSHVPAALFLAFLGTRGASWDRFWSPKGCQKGGILGAKVVQKRTQIASKMKTIFDIEKMALQDRLGPVLG